MKKSEIYHMINSLLQQNREQSKSSQHSFVNNYVKEFLRKQKLIPRNRFFRMKEIMKNFEELDTYVDLSDIVAAIENHIRKQRSQQTTRSNMSIGMSMSMGTKSRVQTEPVDSTSCPKYADTIRKAEKLMKKCYKSGHYAEMNKCKDVLKLLESSSTEMMDVKYRNNSSKPAYHELIKRKYLDKNQLKFAYHPERLQEASDEEGKNQEPEDKHEDNTSTVWRILREKGKKEEEMNEYFKNNVRAGQFIEQNSLERERVMQQRQKISTRKTNSIKKSDPLEHAKLLQTAACYLHIILQRQHQKKWAFKKLHIKTEACEMSEIQKEKNSDPEQIIQSNSSEFKKDMRNSSCVFTQKLTDKTTNNGERGERVKKVRIREQQIIEEPQMKLNGKLKLKKILTQGSIRLSKHKLSPNHTDSLAVSKIRKMPRHTITGLSFRKDAPLAMSFEKKQAKAQYEQKCKLRQHFTFKKRKVKERVLKRINEFVNSIDFTERSMILESKWCEKQIERVKDKVNMDYSNYVDEKFINDEKALEGVRWALSLTKNKKC